MSSFVKSNETMYDAFLAERRSRGMFRSLRASPGADTLDFTHNDYLCLSSHPRLIERAAEYAARWGVGSRASRLVSGNLPIFEMLEEKIADAKGTEAALIFATGYQTNATVLAALLDKGVLGRESLVVADKLNHASMHLGCRTAGVRQRRYPNLDLNAAARLFDKTKTADDTPRFLLTESVFSMDGSRVDIGQLSGLAQQYDAFLYVDEAHATGVLGTDGYGLAKGRDAQVIMGTFSKALGSAGGYVACSRLVRDYVLNACGGFIFSTAPSPAQVGAADAGWDLVPELAAQREALQKNAAWLRGELTGLGYDTGVSSTQIIPLILGEVDLALAAHTCLMDQGIATAWIRPPAVPPHTSRLRISLNVGHTRSDLERLLDALSYWKRQS